MRELHVERKDRTVWPWVIGALVVAAILLWLFVWRDRGGTDIVDAAAPAAPAAPGAVTDTAVPAGVAEFLRFADGQRAAQAAGPSHDYTADGLRHLAGAVDALVERDTVLGRAVGPRVAALRERADAMQRDAGSTDHAQQAREAFLLAADLLQAIQEGAHPGLTDRVGEVRQAATAVRADRRLLDQTAEVQRFFDGAAAALRGMTGAA